LITNVTNNDHQPHDYWAHRSDGGLMLLQLTINETSMHQPSTQKLNYKQ